MQPSRYYKPIPLNQQKSRGRKEIQIDPNKKTQILKDKEYGLNRNKLKIKYNISGYLLDKILKANQ